MSNIVYDNNDITSIRYSGYTITRAYACGGELVFESVPPFSGKLSIEASGNEYTIDCNGYSTLRTMEDVLYLVLTNNLQPSAVTEANIGGCVTVLDDDCFNRFTSMSAVTIPNSVTTIGNDAFYECYSLSSLTIPSSVTTIGSNAFDGCHNLSAITIPSSVTVIDADTFKNCNRLKEIVIPSGVTSIGMDAFELEDTANPTEMAAITDTLANRRVYIYAATPPTVGTNAFDSSVAGVDATYPIYVPCDSLNAYKTAWTQYASRIYAFPNTCPKYTATYLGGVTYSAECDSNTELGVSDIRNNGHKYSAMTAIEVGTCVTSLHYSFLECTNLRTVSLPNTLTRIGGFVFNKCRSLQNLEIPSGVTRIGEQSIKDCTSLQSVIIHAVTPPTRGISDGNFQNTNNCPIYVPAESVELYKTANYWNGLASRIYPIQ